MKVVLPSRMEKKFLLFGARGSQPSLPWWGCPHAIKPIRQMKEMSGPHPKEPTDLVVPLKHGERLRAFRQMWIPWTVAFFLAAMLLVRTALLVARYHVNVPYLDQWWLLPVILRDRESGGLPWGYLWHQNAEHRLFFPKLFMLWLARYSGWDLRWELVANFVIAGLTAILMSYEFWSRQRLLGQKLWPWFLPLACASIFTLAAYENWIWSWQLPYFLVVLCSVISTGCIARIHQSALLLVGGATAAAIATFSFATGAAVWFASAITMLCLPMPSEQKRRLFLFWSLCASACFSGYLIGYEFLRWNDPVAAVFSLGHFLGYICTYLGAALVPTHWVYPAAILGVGYVVLGTGIILLIGRKRNLAQAYAPFLGWWAFSFGAAFLTAVGRSNVHDWTQAMTPRYITYSLVGWIGLFAIGAIYWQSIEPQKRASRAVAIVLAIFVADLLGMSLYGVRGLAGMSQQMREGAEELQELKDLVKLRKIYADPVQLRDEFGPQLKAHRLCVFKESPRDTTSSTVREPIRSPLR